MVVKAAIAVVVLSGALIVSAPQRVYPIHAVPHGDVELLDGFWRTRLDINRTAIVSGIASEPGDHVFMAIEAAAYALKRSPDAKLAAQLDALIDAVAKRQDPIHTSGHLYEAAVAHFEATGSRRLLDMALKHANVIAAASGDRAAPPAPGAEAIEMGLIRLFRATGVPRYYDAARRLLDGRSAEPRDRTGDAVRDMYLYAAMADVAGLEGDKTYLAASERTWRETSATRMSLTGGIGETGAAGHTCAPAGAVFWNARMFLTTGNTTYLDLLERTLYNAVLSNVDACPADLARTIAQMPGYIYAWEGETLFVNLYTGSRARVPLGRGPVTITQATDYPWDGEVRMRIDPGTPRLFTVAVRNPAWTGDRPFEGAPYRYVDGRRLPPPMVEVNGQPFIDIRGRGGFITVLREWKPGDEIRIRFDMPVRRVAAELGATSLAGRVAFERGPLVYAFAARDNGGPAGDLVVPPDARVESSYRRNLLGGVQVITGQAMRDGRRVTFTAIPSFARTTRGPDDAVVWIRDR